MPRNDPRGRLRGKLGRSEWIAVGIAIAVLCLSATRPIFRTIALGDWSDVETLQHDDWRFFRY